MEHSFVFFDYISFEKRFQEKIYFQIIIKEELANTLCKHSI